MRFLIKHPQVLTNIMLMRTKSCLVLAVWVVGLCLSARAATYSGNGNSGFGGAIGQGSLSLTDDGTTVSGTVTRGAGPYNDILVLYVDSGPGGFANTLGFTDSGDGSRKAISGIDGGGERSVLTMPSGFLPDYAIALGPASERFCGAWQLLNCASLPFVRSVNLISTGHASSSSYTFSFDVLQIVLCLNHAQSCRLFCSYIYNTGFG